MLGAVLLETTEANAQLGLLCYCGTFEVRDGRVIHHREIAINPSLDGTVAPRSVVLDGERLILHSPSNEQAEWQRVR